MHRWNELPGRPRKDSDLLYVCLAKGSSAKVVALIVVTALGLLMFGAGGQAQTPEPGVALTSQPPVLLNPGTQRNSDSSNYEHQILRDTPRAYWRLADAAGSIAADSAGSSHGSAEGAVLFRIPGALNDGNGAMQFDGADTTRIKVPSTPALASLNGGSAISMEAWIQPQSAILPSGFRMFFSFPGRPASYLGITNSGGALRVIAALWIGDRQRYISTGPVLTPGNWYHTAATYDGERMTLYVNGDIAGQITGLSGVVSLGTTGVLLGGHQSAGNSYNFVGAVDEAALYGSALTAAHVADHYDRRSIGGTAVAVQLEASDADGDALAYSAAGLPPSLSVNPSTGLISGTLTRADTGSYTVTATVSDGSVPVSQQFTWVVTHINRAPVLANPGNQLTVIANSVSLPATGTDPDGDPLTYNATGLPASLLVDSNTGLISGTVAAAEIGSHPVSVTASDGQLEVTQTFTWEIVSPNRAPVLDNPGDQLSISRPAGYSRAVSADGPAGYWRFSDAAGVSVTDLTSNSNGAVAGTGVLPVPGALADSDTAASFAGTDASGIAVPNSPALAALNGTAQLTFESWIKPDTLTLPARFAMFHSFPGNGASYLGVTTAFGGYKVIAALWINGRQRYVVSNTSLSTATWYHIAATYDGARLALYVNGLVAGELTDLSGSALIGTAGMLIGRHPLTGLGYAFSGAVDEVAIYGKALTAGQLATHYDLRTEQGSRIVLPLQASDADGDALRFGATGLPLGLAIDPVSGVVAGPLTPESTGHHVVTVTVSDREHLRAQSFAWTVVAGNGYSDGILSDSPAAFWRLDDAGAIVADAKSASPGTRSPAVKTGLPGALGDGNSAMDFDGIDGTVVSIPGAPQLNALDGRTAISLEAWIRPENLTMPGRFRMFFSFPGNPASYLGITDAFGAPKIIAALWIGGKQRYLTAGPALSAGSWYHVVAVYDGAELSLYVNGVLAAKMTGLSGPVTVGTRGVLLGGHPSSGSGYNFDGLVDEAALYAAALTPAQVAKHYSLRSVRAMAGLTVTADRTAPQAAGTAITFTATADGGVAPHQYKWLAYSSTSGWTTLREWSASPTLVWTPAVADWAAQITVWARSANEPTGVPERTADVPFPVFVTSPATTSQLITPADGGSLDRKLAFRWIAIAGAEAYRLQIGENAGGAEIFDSGELLQTTHHADRLPANRPAASVVWSYDELDLNTVWGYALLLDGDRTDLGWLPGASCGTTGTSNPCFTALLPPLANGPHTVAVSAYNYLGETLSANVEIAVGDTTLHARLWTKHGGVWRFVDSTFQLSDSAARFLHPIALAQNVNLLKPLRWNAIGVAEAYSVSVGTAPGLSDLLHVPELQTTSLLAETLPGYVALYARLGTRLDGVWRYTDTTFTAIPLVARLVHPTADALIRPAGNTFWWTPVPQVESYILRIGTTAGGSQVFDSGETSANSLTVPALPENATLYARLSTRRDGVWRTVDTTFRTGSANTTTGPLAALITPADGGVVASETLEVTWTPSPTAIGYHVHVGTSPGADDIGMSADYMTETAWTSNVLPPGQTLYVRLYTQFAVGDWNNYVDITVTTAPPAPPLGGVGGTNQ
jgi:hypothetical protein